MDFLGINIIDLLGGVTVIVTTVLGYVIKKYVIPWLRVETRRRYAEYLAHLADEFTDDMVINHPNTWWEEVDKAVDFVMERLGIAKETGKRLSNEVIAKRVVTASLSRKIDSGAVTSENVAKAKIILNGGTNA